MQRAIKNIICTFLAIAFLISCGDGASLQRYYVDNQASKNFMTQDIPLSMIKIDKTNFTKEQWEAYSSVNKLNFLGYKSNENDINAYKNEVEKVKTILKDDKYKDLMEFSDKGNKILVKYVGDEDDANEVIIFGSSKEVGFGIVRILGKDMNPDKMVTLISTLQNSDVEKSQIQDIMNFFK